MHKQAFKKARPFFITRPTFIRTSYKRGSCKNRGLFFKKDAFTSPKIVTVFSSVFRAHLTRLGPCKNA